MLKITINLALLFFIFTLQAQEFSPMEWGEVALSDLEMRRYELDTAAQAVVLGDEGYVNVYIGDTSYEWELRRHRRVKILDEAAVDRYGNATIYYYHEDGSDNVKQIKAQTIAPDGTITEVDKKEVYREKINEYWTKISFGFPNVVPGCVVEYRYQHYSDRWVVPGEWTFREHIPVRSSYYKFGCKAPIVYTYLLQGAEYMPGENFPDGRQKLHLDEMELLVDGTAFWMQNGQAIKEEAYMTTLEDYYIKVRFQASERMNASGGNTSVYGTWEDANKRLLEHSKLGENYRKRRNHKKILEDAVLEIDATGNQSDIVAQVADFVQREIKWSGTLGIFTDGSIDDAYLLHEADLPEIQYAGIALLRHFGIEADPLILSSRDNGAMITSFPFLDQFNYVAILATVDGSVQLLDFSDPFLSSGNIQVQALNGKAFLLHEETPAWINLTVPTFQDILACSGKINADGSIEGEMKCTMRAYSARNDRVAMDDHSLVDIWSDRLPTGTEIIELEAENEKDIKEPLIVTGKYQLMEAGFSNDDFLYVSPLVYSSFSENPFLLEQRSYPVDFPYPFEEKAIYSYAIPEGYVVDALPENVTIALPDRDAMFQYMVRENNNKISILVIINVQKTKYLPTEYEALKSIFETAAQKMQEQIVFKKI